MKLTLRLCGKCYFLTKWRKTKMHKFYIKLCSFYIHICFQNVVSLIIFIFLFLDGRLYLKTTVMYWIFPVEEIHVIVKNFAVRHSSLKSSGGKVKVLLRELPQFCVLMFFKSLSILQTNKQTKIPGSSIDFHLWLYQRPENVCKCTSIKLLTINICNFAAGHLHTELQAGLYKI